MMRVLLLSNMHPSRRWPAYGTFVMAHADVLARHPDIALRRVVITDPRRGLRTPLKYAGFTARAWARAVAERFDIVHVHYAHPTALGAAVAKWRGAKTVITAHGGDVNDMLLRRAPRATRRAFLSADHIIAVSEDLRGKLQSVLGEQCPGISVCNMGIDTERFTPQPHAPSSPARLLFVGRLVDCKGADTLLRAAAAVETPWVLDIVGTGVRHAEMEALAEELEIGDRVTFHGPVPPSDLPAFYRRADLLVGPSREEGAGLAFLEAAASGCPVVAAHTGGIPENFTDNESALLVPPDNPGLLTGAIERALTDSVLRERLIAGGLAAAERNSQGRSIDHTLSVYRQLMETTA